MMPSEQIDIEVSRLRTMGAVFICLSFCLGPAWILYEHPASFFARLPPGSFQEFALWAAIPVFGFVTLLMIPLLLRTGVLVSIGPKGIFDRRLSTDWIPWAAIQDVGRLEMKRQHAIAIRLDPNLVASLPLLERRRKAARRDFLGPNGFLIWGADIKGGFKALDAAVIRVLSRDVAPSTDGQAAR